MKRDYEIFNIGTGMPVSVLEIVRTFEQANGVKLNYRMAPRRPGDVTAIWADPSLANRELGWKAQYGIAEMCSSSWKFERMHTQAK